MPAPFVDETIAVLTRAPAAYDALLRGLPEPWTTATEGEGTWSPYIVLGHLVATERNNWMPRLLHIVEEGPSRPFAPVDREAQFRDSQGKSLATLLDEFRMARCESLASLRALDLDETQLALTGAHPTLGTVTARQLLATWAAHDLAHLVQVSRTMAKRYREEVGPFAQFLSVMR
jgi:hypothetical protein